MLPVNKTAVALALLDCDLVTLIYREPGCSFSLLAGPTPSQSLWLMLQVAAQC